MITLDTDKVELSPLEQFIKDEQKHMRSYMAGLIRSTKQELKRSPENYKESEDCEPSVDIRLCVDKPVGPSTRVHPPDNWTWCVHTGSADYDQYHSDYCAASLIGLDTKVDDLLLELVDQILEQGGME